MAEGRVGVSSRGGGGWMYGTAGLGVGSSAPSVAGAGAGDGEDGALGVSSSSSCGETGEKLGNETRDLSDSAIEVAELEGCDVSLPLLLLVARTVADLCDLVECTDACEMERSSSSGDVEASASILA
jgi:hypothetical protein